MTYHVVRLVNVPYSSCIVVGISQDCVGAIPCLMAVQIRLANFQVRAWVKLPGDALRKGGRRTTTPTKPCQDCLGRNTKLYETIDQIMMWSFASTQSMSLMN